MQAHGQQHKAQHNKSTRQNHSWVFLKVYIGKKCPCLTFLMGKQHLQLHESFFLLELYLGWLYGAIFQQGDPIIPSWFHKTATLTLIQSFHNPQVNCKICLKSAGLLQSLVCPCPLVLSCFVWRLFIIWEMHQLSWSAWVRKNWEAFPQWLVTIF